MLYIHVGLHKTGSTSLQSFCSQASISRRSNFAYLGHNNWRSPHGFEPPKTDSWETRRLNRALRHNRHVVISSENLLGSLWTVYSQASSSAAALDSYLDEVADYRLVLYLRPHHEWIPSVYAEHIKWGSTETMDTVAARLLRARNARFSTLVADLESVVGLNRIIVRPVSKGTDVAKDFQQVTQIEAPAVEQALRSNASVDTLHVELMRRMNADLSISQFQQNAYSFFAAQEEISGIDQISVVSEQMQKSILQFASEDFQTLAGKFAATNPDLSHNFMRLAESLDHQPVLPHFDVTDPDNLPRITKESCTSLRRAIPDAAKVSSGSRRPTRSLVRQLAKRAKTQGWEFPLGIIHSLQYRLTHNLKADERDYRLGK